MNPETTREWITRFEAEAQRLEQTGPTEQINPRLHQASIDACRSQAEDLKQQLKEHQDRRTS